MLMPFRWKLNQQAYAMRHYLIYVVILLIISGTIRQANGSFHKSRTWHEQFVPKPGDLGRVLHANYKTCIAPGEKPEQVSPESQSTGDGATIEKTWSYLMSMFASHGGFELYSWDHFTRETDPEISTTGMQVWGLIVFIIFSLLLFILFTCFIPVIGCFMFTICQLAWSLIFHSEIRRICRRILIIKEKAYIKVKSLMPKKERMRSKKPFRLPFLLREYSEEEVPAELLLSGDEDTEPELSSDGFEDLFIRSKGREATGAETDKTHLLHLMASTEKEYEGNRKGSVNSVMTTNSATTLAR